MNEKHFIVSKTIEKEVNNLVNGPWKNNYQKIGPICLQMQFEMFLLQNIFLKMVMCNKMIFCGRPWPSDCEKN